MQKLLDGRAMNLKNYHIILASNSPRRRELLAGLDLDFEVKVLPHVSEGHPDGMEAVDIPLFISKEKASAYEAMLKPNELLITADTMVILGNVALGKPKDDNDAREMLRALSGKTHKVVTGVTLSTIEKKQSFAVATDVTFKELSDQEIDYYVSHYHPLDKAGAYGIQEWIGYVGVTSIHGSYFNVMGLPVQRIWDELHKFID